MDNIKHSLENKASVQIKFTLELNSNIIKLKQKAIIRFVEAIIIKLKGMIDNDKMNNYDLISKKFQEYLSMRKQVLGLLAEISIS